jgi:hypothetical protein
MTERQLLLFLTLLLVGVAAFAVRFMPSPRPSVAVASEVLGGLLGMLIVTGRKRVRPNQGVRPTEPTRMGRLIRTLVVFGGAFLLVTTFGTEVVETWRFPAWIGDVGSVQREGIWIFLISMALTAVSGLLVVAGSESAERSSGRDRTGGA